MRTENALKYTIDTILTIALGYKIDFSVSHYSEKNIEIVCRDKKINFLICRTDGFQELLEGKLKLSSVSAFDEYSQIPVIKINEEENLYKRDEEKIIVNFDLLSLPFILLSSLDEYLSEDKDEYDRFLYTNSISKKYDLIKTALVDEYAMLIRTVIQKEYPDIEIRPRKFSVTPTHDIDDIYRFTGPFKAMKSIIGQLVNTWNFKEVFSAFIFFLQSLSDKRRDPYFKGTEKLLKDSEVNGLKSVFFFMAANPSAFDSGYDIYDENLKEVFKKIDASGMTSGIHPGFYTFRDVDVLNEQVGRVAGATEKKITNSRQHYLRFDRRKTFDNLEKAGIHTDYTMGFAEEEGFKCGTSHEFHPYDLSNDRPYKIKEKPLIAMDVTMSMYKKYSVSEARQVLETLCERVKRTGGDFIILWHNAYVYREMEFYNKVYLEFLKKNTG
ncbi:polysaccharide deacetylase family protein [Chryseobacterium vrystaatense]|uniref:DUF7033 domain-containing protein n=1 Tax=Chryseobacterium vrystaatense TaxID=307480 RepID=A0ABR4UIM9_9FLAO|nr:polysaccharide deacetylase family protein [Chryseobacterium vrystaatense]KFF24550.1 hypothetical protein IW16_19725 [Chryseobacterium vrystaatense]